MIPTHRVERDPHFTGHGATLARRRQ
jgi:hypothetical protein